MDKSCLSCDDFDSVVTNDEKENVICTQRCTKKNVYHKNNKYRPKIY